MFAFPLPPNRGNARGHTRYLNGKKKKYWTGLDALVATGLLPAPPDEAWGAVEYDVVYYLWAYMDDDNAVARAKWLLDWLTTRGYIVDDSRKFCRLASVPEQVIDRKVQRAILTLRRVGTYDAEADKC